MSADPKTFLCLTALCLPATQWAASYLHALGDALQVSKQSVDGAATLTYDPQEGPSMLERAESLAASLRATLSPQDAIAGFVTIFLLTLRGSELVEAALLEQQQQQELKNKSKSKKCTNTSMESKEKARRYSVLRFDARTSVILRRLAYLLRIKLSAVAAFEELAIRELQKETARIQQHSGQTNESNDSNNSQATKKSSWTKHAKIGAAAATAGGLLFVTGGLAAPALAAGLSGLGFAGAATMATTTATATLLGTAGVGLTAYKVTRRIQGLTHFEIKAINTEASQQNTKSKNSNESNGSAPSLKSMTVYICVSGLLREPGPESKEASGLSTAQTSPDFYQPWGAQPPQLKPQQVLDRFYAVVAPSKQPIVPALLQNYAGRHDELFLKLKDIYGVDAENLQPEASRPSAFCSGPDVVVHQQLLREGLEKVRECIKNVAFKINTMEAAIDGTATMALEARAPISDTVVDLFINDQQPWDVAAVPLQPRHIHRTTFTEEETRRALEELELKAKKDESDEGEENDEQFESFSESLTEQTADMLAAEIELLDMEETISTSALTVGNTSKSLLKIAPKATRPDSVYWWRKEVARYGDQYTLIWDPEKLLEISRCVDSLIKEGVDKGIKKALKYTALSAVLTAVAMPMTIISLVRGLDENWTMTGEAADEAGLLLADALLEGAEGNRPVVLVGYSMGGRVVAKCLTELAAVANGTSEKSEKPSNPKQQQSKSYADDDYQFLTQSIENDTTISEKEKTRRLRAATVVRDAVIIGAPVDAAAKKWALRRTVVLGRLINVYCPTDWILSLLYRYKRWSVVPLAGLKAVVLPSKLDAGVEEVNDAVGTVENFDVSDLVDSHGDYPVKINGVLKRVGFGDYSEEFHSRYFVASPTTQ